jgi:hypothetical protein
MQLLADLLGVRVSKSKGERYTEAAGGAYVRLQSEEADEIERHAPPALPGSEKLVMSADGAMVPLLHGEWAEVKTLVIGEVPPPVLQSGEWVVHARKLSYFSRLVNSEQFEHLTLSEVHRRGVENSRQVAAVMDGSDWLQSLVDYHRPDAVRILDFPHAGQRLGQIAQAVWGEDTPETRQWSTERLHQLKHQGPVEVLEQLHQLQAQHSELEVVSENLAYLKKREAQMHYPVFQQQGWPIGSGIVESGNKLVVEARLKGAGMHWKRENVDPMLALRNIICSNRWLQEWPKIEQRLRQQATQRRRALRERHHQAKQPRVTSPPEVCPPVISEQILRVEVASQVESPVQVIQHSGPQRPAANHPWRHSPIGRALYRPTTPAKK